MSQERHQHVEIVELDKLTRAINAAIKALPKGASNVLIEIERSDERDTAWRVTVVYDAESAG